MQCMHVGSYDDVPATVQRMQEYTERYLSDARKVAPEQRKTVIRHPVR